jgi:hypothetical protein
MAQIERQRLQEVYREGIFTRALGRPCSNPHPPDTIENTLWERGWRLIDATREERSLDPFVTNEVPNFTPEKQSNPHKVDALAWLLRGAVALGGSIAIWLVAYSSLRH